VIERFAGGHNIRRFDLSGLDLATKVGALDLATMGRSRVCICALQRPFSLFADMREWLKKHGK
jgi:hypothetical protein